MDQKAETGTSPAEGLSSPTLRFAQYLRSSEANLDEDPKLLAARFDLPEELVRESLAFVGRHPDRVGGGHSIMRRPGRILGAAFALMEGRPVASAAIASALFYGLFLYLRSMPAPGGEILSSLSLLVGLTLVMAINFLRGQLRYSVLIACTSVVVGLGALYLSHVLRGLQELDLPLISYNINRAGSAALLLATFGGVMAVLGAFFKITRSAIAERRLNRLQLLQRVFVLRERLATPMAEASKEMRIRSQLRWIRERWLLVATGGGVAVAFLTVFQLEILGASYPYISFVRQLTFILALVALIGIYPLVGFAVGSWWKGLLAALAMDAISGIAWILPLPGLGIDNFLQVLGRSPLGLLNIPLLALMAAVGGMGASVEEKSSHRRRVEDADQSAMLTELIRLQQMLRTGSAEACVAVIDCVQSTRMKQDADALAVEISFREFHEFVDREVARHNGRIHAATGDGVVAEFPVAAEAFAAARQIQTLVPQFNKTANRLALPFRVRIGIHRAEVEGSLENVMFARVIDIAAHAEKRAPAGGIVVTGAVRDLLPQELFGRLADDVDGISAYIAMHPTGD
ncbi:MAG TPA: hypothetical protein VFG65_03815 [Fimbriimonadales bacterium]|jgi:class 3 adenylate cyclase|nr:hypothetical protein [Fimbriimonadales bacterium]